MAVSIDKLARPRTISHFGSQAILIDALQREMTLRNISSISLRDYSVLNSGTQIVSHRPRGILMSILSKLFHMVQAAMLIYLLMCSNIVVNCFLMMLNAGLLPILLFLKKFGLFTELTENQYLLHGHLAAFHNRHRFIQIILRIGYFTTFLILFMGIYSFSKITLYLSTNTYVEADRQYLLYTVLLIELLNVIVCRTRLSIVYTCKILSIVLFLTSYALIVDGFNMPQYYISMCLYSSIIHYLILIIYVEASVASLSDDCIHKPTYDRPRTYYFPVFNIRWHDGLPPLWTLLVPLAPRESFSSRQLSYVDKNYEVMHAQISGLAANEEEVSLDAD